MILSSAGLSALSVVRAAVLAPTFIDGYHFRLTVVANGLTKETQCCGGIPSGSQQEINALSCNIDGLLQVFPLPSDSDVGFVHSPAATRRAFRPSERLIQHRHQADDPAVKRGVINNNAPLNHHLFEVAQAE